MGTPITIRDDKRAINTEIRLAQAEDSWAHEEIANAIEAGATVAHFGKINPNLFGIDQAGYNKVKLYYYDDGCGMTGKELKKFMDFSSSGNEKDVGFGDNLGKGAKLSSANINEAGLIWISCKYCAYEKRNVVNLICLWYSKEHSQWEIRDWEVEDENGNFLVDCLDITDVVEANIDQLGDRFKTDKSWTCKIYCGKEPKQNTITHPYGVDFKPGWLVKELTDRWVVKPKNFDITLDACLKDGHSSHLDRPFLPVLDAIHFSKSKYKWDKDMLETVNLNLDTGQIKSLGMTYPVKTAPNELNVTYVYDPKIEYTNKNGKTQKMTQSHIVARSGNTGVFSGLIWNRSGKHDIHELYDFRGRLRQGGNTWTKVAPQIGVFNRYDCFRIFVWLPRSDAYRSDNNRTKLLKKTDTGEYREIKLVDFAQ